MTEGHTISEVILESEVHGFNEVSYSGEVDILLAPEVVEGYTEADLVLDAEVSGTNEVSYSNETETTLSTVVEGSFEAELEFEFQIQGFNEVSYSNETEIHYDTVGQGAFQAEIDFEGAFYSIQYETGDPIEVIVPTAGYVEAEMEFETLVQGETTLTEFPSQGHIVAEVEFEALIQGKVPLKNTSFESNIQLLGEVQLDQEQGINVLSNIYIASSYDTQLQVIRQGHIEAEIEFETVFIGSIPSRGSFIAEIDFDTHFQGVSPVVVDPVTGNMYIKLDGEFVPVISFNLINK